MTADTTIRIGHSSETLGEGLSATLDGSAPCLLDNTLVVGVPALLRLLKLANAAGKWIFVAHCLC